jgi:hypothetical protein
MPVGFEMDGISFTSDGLKGMSSHAAVLGQVVTAFSLIEGVVGGIYGMLRHQTIEQGIEELQALPTNARRVQAVRQAMTNCPSLAADPSHDDLMKNVLSYSERRNRIAHGLWGVHPNQQDVLYRLPVKKWINYIATVVSSGTDGTSNAKIDELKTYLETYNLAELSSLKTDGDNLLVEVLKLFNALALSNAKGDGWVESPLAD